MNGLCAYAVCLGVGQSGHAKCADEHLSSDAAEQRIATARKMLEAQSLHAVESLSVHRFD